MRNLLILTILLLGFVSTFNAQEKKAKSSQKDAVKAVIQIYLDGMAKADHDLLGKTFHPEAKINRVIPDGTVFNWIFADWVKYVVIHSDYPKPLASSKIEKIEILGNAKSEAFVQLRMTYRGVEYVELITLLKLKDYWKIINKTFDGKYDEK